VNEKICLQVLKAIRSKKQINSGFLLKINFGSAMLTESTKIDKWHYYRNITSFLLYLYKSMKILYWAFQKKKRLPVSFLSLDTNSSACTFKWSENISYSAGSISKCHWQFSHSHDTMQIFGFFFFCLGIFKKT